MNTEVSCRKVDGAAFWMNRRRSKRCPKDVNGIAGSGGVDEEGDKGTAEEEEDGEDTTELDEEVKHGAADVEYEGDGISEVDGSV